jgi:DNA polymerase III alpha subunit
VNIDSYGRVTITEQEAFDGLYTGKLKSLDNVNIDGNLESYNKAKRLNADPISLLTGLEDLTNTSRELFDESNQCDWFMPEDYHQFPLVHWLYTKCTTDEQIKRVDRELELFIQHGMLDLLFYLKYLVDTMRENNIVWGVGRGSSVASYVLYLLGVHKIDSIKYELDIHEFLKEK